MKPNTILQRMVVMLITLMCAISANAQEAYANYTPSNTTLTFYYDNQRSSRSGTTYDLNTGTVDPGWYNEHSADITHVNFTTSFSAARPTSTYSWFASGNYDDESTSKLISITGIKNLNTSEVTEMSYMFWHCSLLSELDVSGFNTAKVTNMCYMFYNCSSLKSLDVSGFNTAEVTDMGCMFENCSSLKDLDVSGFDTHNVKYMDGMFSKCSGLTNLDVSGFDTHNVEYMNNMFFSCHNLTSLDLNSFDTGNVTEMTGMFRYCVSLETIYVSDAWTTKKVTSGDNMFFNCIKLAGGKGTAFDSNHTGYSYAQIDGGASNPGYMTNISQLKYDLLVGGTLVTGLNRHNIPITSGTASYIPSTKTLTLNNAVINSTGQGNNAIMNENPYYYGRAIDGLTIEVIGNCQLTSEDVALIIGGNTTIVGNGTLTLKSTTEKGIWIDNQTLVCKVNKLIVDAYKEPIYGIGDGSGMRINGSYVELNSQNPDTYNTVDCLAVFALQNSHFADPGGAWKYADTDKYIYNTSYRRLDLGTEIYRGKLLIEPNTAPVKYRLWVAGTRVTSANKNNISVSSGTATFDPDTRTLTLNNAQIVVEGYDDGISNGLPNIEGMPDFKIKCSGTNSIDAIESDGFGLALYGNTTISGSKLGISAYKYGIYLTELKELTFWNADVYTEASYTTSSYPIRCGYNSVVNVFHSRLEAEPGSTQNSPVYGPIAFNMTYSAYADPGNSINPELLYYNDDEQMLEMYYGQYPYDGTLLIEPTEISISTGIENSQRNSVKGQRDEWYDLSGRKLNGMPNAKGVYIHNGKTVIR